MLDICSDYCWGGSIETVTRVPHPTGRNHGMPRQGLTQGHVRRRESPYVRVSMNLGYQFGPQYTTTLCISLEKGTLIIGTLL